MNSGPIIKLLDPNTKPIPIIARLPRVTVPASHALILRPDTAAVNGYPIYKRAQ